MERRAGGLRKNLAVVFGAVSGNKGRRRYVCFMMKCWNFFRAGDSVRGGVSRAGKVACAYSARGGLRALRVVAVGVAAVLLCAACSNKKNTAASRNWQAFNTRYNVYFNGNEHYKETLKEMEQKYEDDYTRTVMMHPAEARANEKLPQPTGDFKRTIEKMQKAIQLHSISKKPAKKSGSKKEKEFRARTEFNPFLHNAWMMMGKAQFQNGDFLGAASTFFYITKQFRWLPKTVLEAQLWEAWSYCAMDWLYEAENILGKIDPKKIEDKKLLHLYNMVEADMLVRGDRLKESIPFLTRAAEESHGTQRNRQYFLLGQVYSRLGDKKMAYEAFRKAGSGASTPYRAKFNARIRQSEVYTGSNIKSEVNALKSMARYERNKEFLDQIYYAIGNLYLSRKDTVDAIKNYALAVEKSTRNGVDKALAAIALGEIYFAQGEYQKAQPLYSEGIPQLNDNYPQYKELKKRSDVLDELSVYAGNVHLQDSLLTLSKLTPEEQMKVCQKIVDELKKKEKEEAEAARLEEAKAQAAANGNQQTNSNAPQTYQMNTDKSWYFYNQQAKNTGKTEFQKRWGARKLEDDWRRRNKNTFNLDGDDENTAQNDSIAGGDGGEISNDSTNVANDPHNPEYYLRQIPKTPEEIQNCNDIVMEGLYNMGLILKDKLEDFPAARREFNELDERYPDNIYRLDVYYNMYLMAVRRDEKAEAERWRQRILADFPESSYGKAMLDPQYIDNLRRMHAREEEMYAETYQAYLDNNNQRVRRLVREMEEEFPLSALMPKFVFLDALSYVTAGDTDNFRKRLEEMLQKWPETDMTEMASGMLRNLQKGMTVKGGGSNSRGMIWDTRLTDDAGQEKAADGQPANFDRNPNTPHYLVYAFPRDSVNANALLYEVARFNFSTFTVEDYDLEQMSFGNVGLLIIKGFRNRKQVEEYRKLAAGSPIMQLPASIRPIMISKGNFELLLREGRSFDEYFRFEEKAGAEATEESVVGPDRTMPPGPEGETPEGEAPAPESEAAPGGETPEEVGEVPAPEEQPAEEEGVTIEGPVPEENGLLLEEEPNIPPVPEEEAEEEQPGKQNEKAERSVRRTKRKNN